MTGIVWSWRAQGPEIHNAHALKHIVCDRTRITTHAQICQCACVGICNLRLYAILHSTMLTIPTHAWWLTIEHQLKDTSICWIPDSMLNHMHIIRDIRRLNRFVPLCYVTFKLYWWRRSKSWVYRTANPHEHKTFLKR